MEPQLRVFRGGWMAVGDGLAVTASSGQEALLRFAIERRRLAEECATLSAPAAAGDATVCPAYSVTTTV